MADAGYGTAQNYIYAQEKHADVILRITPKTFCLYNAGGDKSGKQTVCGNDDTAAVNHMGDSGTSGIFM